MTGWLRLRLPGDRAGAPWTADAIAAAVTAQLAAEPPANGTRLPPPEAVALRLAVGAATVVRAYAQLVAQGGATHADGGWVVAPGAAAGTAPSPPAPRLRPPPTANPPARGTPGCITLSSAFLDPRLAPTAEIASCMRAALADPGPSTYAHVQGYPPLRAVIARRLARVGITADPDHILITVGSQQVLDLVCRALVVKSIATEDPGYLAAKALFELADIRVTPLPVDPFAGLDRDRWRERLTASRPALAYLTSSFQNPTGYAYSSGELAEILGWAAELGFGILEDDWGADMLPHAECQPTLRALGGPGVLYMNAFTKKTLPSLRVGYVVADERTLPSLLAAKKLAINGTPAMLEETLVELIERGHYDAYLARTHAELAARYRHCVELLRELMPPEARWTTPGGGPILWLALPRDVDLVRLRGELAERKVLINLQDGAFYGPPSLHGFMLGYAFPTRAEMTTAIEILAERIGAQLAGR